MLYFDMEIGYSKELSPTLNNFSSQYPKLYKWSNKEFLNELKKSWLRIDTLQKNHVECLLNNKVNPICGTCFYTLSMVHVVLKAPSVSLGHSQIIFLVHNIFIASKLWIWQYFSLAVIL